MVVPVPARAERLGTHHSRTFLPSLTPLEAEVLELIAIGLSNSESADNLTSTGWYREMLAHAVAQVGVPTHLNELSRASPGLRANRIA